MGIVGIVHRPQLGSLQIEEPGCDFELVLGEPRQNFLGGVGVARNQSK